ncbi:membrane protein [Streptomyces yaizuensis]|uniref:Membrane protein n=1 Tax=Streptomyces yaizuensis TaxID=2989713 RepID=A0ABQ5NTJ8_9ACTN|nr:membrane protein [Streptomyces sp. YSPA8]
MLLLGIILVVMIRAGQIKGGPSVVPILFGFFLASSGLAPSIERALNSIAQAINDISF